MKLSFYAETNIGKKYKNNEDYYSIPSSPKNVINLSKNKTHFILCDGMGGANSGEVASQITSNWLNKELSNISNNTIVQRLSSKFLSKNTNDQTKLKINNAIKETNRKIFELSQKHEQYNGMGTTVVSAFFNNKNLFLHNVGDSRCYRFRNDELTQLTEDQSEVWELYKMGAITKEEIATHPRSNIITMSIGTTKDIEINSYEYEVAFGDKYILCSDGLTDMIADQGIVRIIKEEKDLNNTSNKLIEAALNAGGKDNVTIILIEIIK